jgi:protein TonB
MYRSRALKFAIAIGLHVSLIALALYASLHDPMIESKTHSIKVSLLPPEQVSEAPPPQPAETTPSTPERSPRSTHSAHTPVFHKEAALQPHNQPSNQPSIVEPSAAPSALPDTASLPAASPGNVPAPSARKEAPGAFAPALPDAPIISADCPYRPSPVYPESSNGLREKGNVQLSISISDKGEIDSVDVRKSSGVTSLDEAARHTVLEQWHCVPAHQGGKRLPARVAVLIQFISR